MNTDENQKIWIEKIHQNLILRGRSYHTFINYKSSLSKFFKYYDSNIVLKYLYNLDNNISFHSLKHSFATYYLTHGGSLFKLQFMLGHNSLSTTAIYLHLTQNFDEVSHA